MPGMRGEEEEQPARRSAVCGHVSWVPGMGSGGRKRKDVQSRMMAMAIKIMSTWW